MVDVDFLHLYYSHSKRILCVSYVVADLRAS